VGGGRDSVRPGRVSFADNKLVKVMRVESGKKRSSSGIALSRKCVKHRHYFHSLTLFH
jgi:hypothetical protein